MKIKHIFFDLDRTLWDFDANSQKTLDILYHKYELNRFFEHFIQFANSYKKINADLWKEYGKNKISKEFLRIGRFKLTLEEVGVFDEELSAKLSNDYVKISPVQTLMFPNTKEMLIEFQKMNIKMHIITNGFKEVQYTKLSNCGIINFFDVIVCSEDVGVNKPDKAIFDFAMSRADANAHESIMIGDDLEVDVDGAIRAGLHAVLFDPENKYSVSKEVHKIKDLQNFPFLVTSIH